MLSKPSLLRLPTRPKTLFDDSKKSPEPSTCLAAELTAPARLILRKPVFPEATETSLHNTLVRFIRTKGMQNFDSDLYELKKEENLNGPELADNLHDLLSARDFCLDDGESICAPGYEQNVYKLKDVDG